MAEDNVNVQNNPSYFAVGNSQVKPEAEDNANKEDNVYINVQ